MKDEEVGELWRQTQDGIIATDKDAFVMIAYSSVEGLIRKLIEERAKRRFDNSGSVRSWMNIDDSFKAIYIARACKDFGIDPKTYSERE